MDRENILKNFLIRYEQRIGYLMAPVNRKKPPDHSGDRGGGESKESNRVTAMNSSTQTTERYPPSLASSRRGRCGWKSVTFLSILVALAAVVAAHVVTRMMMGQLVIDEMMLSLGEDGVNTFKAYDRDGDGYLNVIEFEPLLERLNVEDTTERGDISYSDENIDPTEEVLTVQASFIPLQQDTLSKAKELSFLSSRASLASLDNWTTPNEKITAFPASAFRPFLPEHRFDVGKPYKVVTSKLSMLTNQLSSNRYYPPKVKGKEVIVHRLLTSFHKRPFIHSRFGPQGTVAVVRALSADYADIIFRVHAEFQLNEPPNHPFWFTPAMFLGHLTMRRDTTHIEHFRMYVPTNRSLNVDMEWMNGPNEVENMEVDIGFMPRMELVAMAPSSQVTIYAENGDVLFQAPDDDGLPWNDGRGEDGEIAWDEEISEQEALVLLDKELYPFKKVDYMPLNEAHIKAEAEQKLVHHILLWGALDDQSC